MDEIELDHAGIQVPALVTIVTKVLVLQTSVFIFKFRATISISRWILFYNVNLIWLIRGTP